MNYFQVIIDECDKLDKLGNEYLDKFSDFVSNEDMAITIYNKAWDIFEESGRDWDGCPDWVILCVDSHVPYAVEPTNGSLFYSLGYSLASNDAHLRNLYEIAMGRETEELDFPVLVSKEKVDEICGIS